MGTLSLHIPQFCPFRLVALELRRTMSEMKLTYFNLMGRAETTRLILAQAGVAFEDKRIEPAEWPALKASLPMGQLPILEVDGSAAGGLALLARTNWKALWLTRLWTRSPTSWRRWSRRCGSRTRPRRMRWRGS